MFKKFLPPYREGVFFALCVTTLLLNLADAVTTLWVLSMGAGREGNPLMAYLLGVSPILFATVKMWLSGVFSIVIWHARNHIGAHWALFGTVVIYVLLNLWHICGLTWVFLL